MTTNTIVIYHANCPDGFAAAWAAYKKLGLENVTYHAAVHGTEPPDCTDAVVYVLDYCYPPHQMYAIAKAARTVTVLDHHKTAMEAMKDFSAPNVVLVFAMERSGAGLTWRFFNGSEISPPMFIEYVEDRDLWRFKLPSSKAVNAYLSTIPYSFEAYDELDSGKRGSFADAVSRGETVIAKQAKYVQEASNNAFPITFLGHKAIAVNACQVDVSELMHSLLERWPPNYLFAVAFWVLNDKRMTFGFRSRSGGFDVSDLAKGLGGGGHPQAAGAQLEMRQALQLLGFV